MSYERVRMRPYLIALATFFAVTCYCFIIYRVSYLRLSSFHRQRWALLTIGLGRLSTK
jgi:hypothetical protein